ncbi:hypothetical protein C2S52_022938 [Perilla frutescens var. hirtella]|nr:hypothetical protein C2S52_022938 [Perilla frutescens var. hirtella]
MITEVLRGADTLREEGSYIRVWIQQLRSIDHEIVNVLDMYAYKNANGNGNPWYDRWPRMRAHSIAKTVREIETKLRSIKEKREAYLNCFSSHPASTSGEHEAGMISPLHTPEMEIVGVDGPREWLASWVLDVEHAYRVMFVVGTGGSGKTALVKVVYEQLKVEFDCHVWLTAPVFEKMEELLSTMYSKLCNQTGQSSSTSDHTLDDLINMLNDYLRDRRYLIVLDNWKRKDWESVKYAFPKDNCSRVIITTRRGDIASSWSENTVDTYEIPPLPFAKAEELFCRRAFPRSGVYPSVPGLREASERLLKKCEGLPLCIIEMGKVLSRAEISESQFERLENSLQDELKLDSGKLSSITRVLLLSYDELPVNLKCCFQYMSIFPEDHPVNRRMLIRLWMAEGFVRGENRKEPEDIGEEYLEELMERNLVQASEMEFDGRPRTYRVHNLMHKIVLSISEADNFCTVTSNISEKTQRLSIQNTELNVVDKFPHHVHTFFSAKMQRIPPGIIPSMTLLKILHLDHTYLEALPKGIKKLLLLKYLSLRNTRIKLLPISTGRLKHLETLNLKQTFVTELPALLLTLGNLRHLLAGRYSIEGHEAFDAVQGVKVPSGISRLTNLQKLSFVRADKDHTLIQELQNLTKLRKLGIVGLPCNSGPFLCKAIQALTSLRSLSMASETSNQVLEIQGIENPPKLQRLYLWGRLQKMPDWISNLHELVRIRLKWSRLAAANNPMTILGTLNNLLELQLLDAYNGNQLDFRAGTFLKLKILEFDQMEQLQTVMIGNGALPCLQKLSISRCHNLRENPTGIANITQLKELHLRDMPPDFANPLKRNGPLHHFGQHIKIIEEKLLAAAATQKRALGRIIFNQ